MKEKIHDELRSRQLSLKGELVDHGKFKDRAPSMEKMRQNPYKTPPNNLTSKQQN